MTDDELKTAFEELSAAVADARYWALSGERDMVAAHTILVASIRLTNRLLAEMLIRRLGSR